MNPLSPFLDVDPRHWTASNDLAFALPDRFPVSLGHTLVIPKAPVATWFDATREQKHALLDLVDVVKCQLDEMNRPDGYNVGFNAGAAAGQTVMHLHLHVIPRYRGDMDDPRGGVRGVIPTKQKYALLEDAPPKAPFGALPSFVHGEDHHFEIALRSALLDATRADIVSAFVQTSGIDVLQGDLRDALTRGTRIRLVAGDYLGISSPDALRKLLRLADEHAAFQPFLHEVDERRSFHPKAYVFFHGERGIAYVGSSNLSRSALRDGVEWNLRLVSSDDPETFGAIARRFQSLIDHPRTKRLTRALVDAYELRVPERAAPTPEPRAAAPEPNELQRDALDALKKSRREGKGRGLVVLATGLGKTFLSAFDFKAMGGERALFLAHREEILEQAKDTWQSVFPGKVVGSYGGGTRDLDADLLFASVQTLSRTGHLSRFAAKHFDYIVIDEFHHAAAATYRKVLGHFEPRFLLGLTATPERLDGRSLLDLCGDNLVFRRDLVHGITRKLLVPFRYFGIKDEADYEHIPWRSGRFDATELTAAVATEARAAQALREYDKRATAGARRTLCFCASVAHADFMAEFFRRHGKRAAAVHSEPGSAPRTQSLRDLKDGSLEILCAVDVFNEGLDVPDINTVLMLRPTESPVIFLQQLGRGLRNAAGKSELVVVDFIGNHRSFLVKPQSLVFLLGQELPPLVALDKIQGHTLELPDGCSIEIETEAIDLLRSLVQASSADMAVYEYMSFRDANARRPTASELFAKSIGFDPIRKNHESWFHFVGEQGDLSDDEARVLKRHASWFHDLLTTKMVKSYKMLALRALLDADSLFSGTDVAENARRALESVRQDLLLFREMRDDEERGSFGAGMVRKWREMPLQIWARGESTSRPWFQLDGDSFVPTWEVAAEDREVFEEMTEEMVELRLAQHRDRLLRKHDLDAEQAPIVLQLSHANYRPILRFDRLRRADIPLGPTWVTVGGEPYRFDFRKIAVNTASRDGSSTNVLPEVLRSMFGPAAGQPGVRHRARLSRVDDAWHLERDGATSEMVAASNVIPFPRVPYYADVAVACGAMEGTSQQEDVAREIPIITDRLIDPRKHFVVRAQGDSMNGGEHPIEDGDLVLCEWARGMSPEEIEGKPFLLVGHDAADTSFAVMKVPRRTTGAWELLSWNPAQAPISIPKATHLDPVARVLGVVLEPTGLTLYGKYDRDAIAAAFGSVNNPSWKVGHRDIDVGGSPQTVLMVTLRKGHQKKLEHRYADGLVSRTEFAWDSQASTTEDSLKGRRLIGHVAEKRTIHLFVQYDSHQKFTYLGPVTYLAHEGEAPMRVRMRIDLPLPEKLWRTWA